MDIIKFLSSFIYRIRYKLIIGSIISVALAWYFTGYLPKLYTASTTIFTGITSRSSVDDMSGRTDWNSANNAHENIINLVKAKSTLEAVSIKLLAQHLIYGEQKDSKVILPEHYEKIRSITPEDIMELVDKNSFDSTVARFTRYKTASKGNFIYDIFNWDNKYYGYIDLSKIQVIRRGTSDMIEINYTCDDPYIASNTLKFLNEELSARYETLLLSASIDVVRYFEEQLRLAKLKLDASEEDLMVFNKENRIINYEEQTKHLAALNNSFETRYEAAQLDYNSSKALLEQLDIQMAKRAKHTTENEVFITVLSDISTLKGKIVEMEIFGTGESQGGMLDEYKKQLIVAQNKLRDITHNIEGYKTSKEGVAVVDMVDQWLVALIKYETSKAELEVLRSRRKEIDKEYERYSPVGPSLGKQMRNVELEAESYKTILHHLGLAKLKQKNILLDAGTLQIVADADIPLLNKSRKRALYVIAALLGAIIFIIGFYLLLEMLDRTIRDGIRAERLTKGGKVIAAYPTNKSLKHRRFTEEVYRITTEHLLGRLNGFITPNETFVLNLVSIEKGEGKSYIGDRLEKQWIEAGYNVSYISYDKDLNQSSKQFQHSLSLFDIPVIANKVHGFDIVIVEYDCLSQNNVPTALLNEAAVNLMILNAERAWYPSDQVTFDALKQKIDKDSLFICLDNTSREAVEQYTGQLPPYTFLRNLAFRIMNFGLTAKN